VSYGKVPPLQKMWILKEKRERSVDTEREKRKNCGVKRESVLFCLWVTPFIVVCMEGEEWE